MIVTRTTVGRVWFAAVGALAALVSACSAPKPAPTPPPPPPPQVVIPPQPRPPLGAPPGMTIPPVNALGIRQTINTGVGPDQLLWNLRSAYNVAALDCMHSEHTAILDNYKEFLKTYAKALTAANKGVDKQFGVAKGRANVRLREAYMTQVYNYYALPPTLPAFCDAVLAMSNDLRSLPVAAAKPRAKGRAKPAPEGSAKALADFAAANLPKLDRVFLDFYNSYDQYRTDLAAWQQRYAPATLPAMGPSASPSGAATPVPVVVVPVPLATGTPPAP